MNGSDPPLTPAVATVVDGEAAALTGEMTVVGETLVEVSPPTTDKTDVDVVEPVAGVLVVVVVISPPDVVTVTGATAIDVDVVDVVSVLVVAGAVPHVTDTLLCTCCGP